MKGVVSAGDKYTAQAGAEMLKIGGNAFDAACASMLAAPISEPMLTSLGLSPLVMTSAPLYFMMHDTRSRIQASRILTLHHRL